MVPPSVGLRHRVRARSTMPPGGKRTLSVAVNAGVTVSPMSARVTGEAGDLGDVRREGPSVEFFLLGPVEVRIDGRAIDLGGSKQRALLAILLFRANRPVPTELIIDDLWDEAPLTAAKSVQVYVWRLRRLLGEAAGRIETTSSGYRLLADPSEIDVERFRALTASGRAALSTDPTAAAATLREAMALWRGGPLADLLSEPSARVLGPP